MAGGCQWYSGAAWFSPKVDQGQVAVRAIVEILPDFNLAIRGALASRPSTVVGSWRSIEQLGCCFNELKPSCGRVLKRWYPQIHWVIVSFPIKHIKQDHMRVFPHFSNTPKCWRMFSASLPGTVRKKAGRWSPLQGFGDGGCDRSSLGWPITGWPIDDSFGMDLLTQGIGKMDVCHKFLCVQCRISRVKSKMFGPNSDPKYPHILFLNIAIILLIHHAIPRLIGLNPSWMVKTQALISSVGHISRILPWWRPWFLRGAGHDFRLSSNFDVGLKMLYTP